MNMSRDLVNENLLLQQIRGNLEDRSKVRPEGIHVSDLIYPLKSYFNRIHPKKLSEEDMGRFFSGNLFEEIFSNNMLVSQAGKDSGEWNGIKYERDFWDKITGVPIELKSSRQTHRYKNAETGADPKMIDNLSEVELIQEMGSYIFQLKCYMVIYGSLEGILYIFYQNLIVSYTKSIMFGKKVPSLRCYKIKINESEMAVHEHSMIQKRELLLDALERNNPKNLPFCPSWLCKVCPHYQKPCQSIENGGYVI